MKKKHFVSLALVLRSAGYSADSPLVATIAEWCGRQAEDFDAARFKEVVRTGRES